MRFRISVLDLGLAACLLWAAQPVRAVVGAETAVSAELKPGSTVSGVLGPDETHAYGVDLPVDRVWRLDVEAGDNAASIRLLAESSDSRDPAPLWTVRTLYGLGWNETSILPIEVNGSLRVVIEAAEAGAPVGPYSLSVTAVSTDSEVDRRTLSAWRLVSRSADQLIRAEGQAVDPEVREELLGRAQEGFEQAAEQWRRLGRAREELRSHIYLAKLFQTDDRPADAAKVLAQALPLATDAELVASRALLLDRIGYAHLRQGDLDKAQRALEGARDLWRELDRQSGELWTGTTLCLLDLRRGRWSVARSCYETLLPTARAARQDGLVAKLETSLGGVYARLGEPELAIGSYLRAQTLSAELGNSEDAARVQNNLGAFYRGLGRPEEAIEQLQRALEHFREQGDTYWQGRALNNLGYAYLTLGDFQRARPFISDALQLRKSSGDRRGQAISLRNLGRVAEGQGSPSEAVDFFTKALELAEDLGDHRGLAAGHLLLGGVEIQSTEEARGHLAQALALRRQVGDRQGEAEVLVAKGRASLRSGDVGVARIDFQEALGLYSDLRDPAGRVEALYGLARSERRLGELEAARRRSEEAISLVETLRVQIADPSRQAAFWAARQGIYQTLIDVLMDLHRAEPTAGHGQAALEANERFRARTLLDLLEEPALGGDPDIEPDLRKRWRSARLRFDAKARRRLELLGRGAEGAVAKAVESELAQALTELESARSELRRASPRFAALSDPPTLSATEIQLLLDADTVLLEIALGSDRSVVWVVTQDAVTTFEASPRQRLETLARGAHQELTQLDLRSRTSRRRASEELSRELLAPVIGHLRGRRLVVVADGALHYVPFATLPLPEKDGSAVIERFEVVHLPSASALARMRQTSVGKGRVARADSEITIVADPIYHPRDPRLISLVVNGAQSETPAFGARATPTVLELDRLPESREEAQAITDLAPPGSARALIGFEARRDRLLGGEAAESSILHFATHAVVHPDAPELSGLALSQFDDRGRPLDGLLRLHDLLGLRLAADLVVLSSCRSALGQEVRGEGFVGLARGFLYAGVPRVVAGLWQVQDGAAKRLMTSFYRGLLEEGQTPSAALRQAQLALREQPGFEDPFFWGPFVFQGDWR